MERSDIDASLTRIACRQSICEAALILSALPLINADEYVIIGADEILCRPDEATPATDTERYGYLQHHCCRDLEISADSLTLMDVMRWLFEETGDDDDDDCVSLEQVLIEIGLLKAVCQGLSHASTPPICHHP